MVNRSYVAGVKEDCSPEQMGRIADTIKGAFPDQVRITILEKMSTILMDFQILVTREEIQAALGDQADNVRIVGDAGTVTLAEN
jgi:hypothetical protein